MSRIAHRTGGLLVLLLTSTLTGPGAAAQSADEAAAATAADMVEAILQGDDGPPAWDALAAALAPVEPSDPAPAATPLAEAYDRARSAVLRAIGPSPGVEVLAVGAIVLLLAFGLTAVALGQMRRMASARVAAAPAPRRRRRGVRSAPVRRKGRSTACRDAERLEARLRASRAA